MNKKIKQIIFVLDDNSYKGYNLPAFKKRLKIEMEKYKVKEN